MLHLTQAGMAEALNHLISPPSPGHISEFEKGKRQPQLHVLLEYAKMAEITVDELIDDERDLPDGFPSNHPRR
jgi:transcriptional regulator with XRE-family HTH domain